MINVDEFEAKLKPLDDIKEAQAPPEVIDDPPLHGTDHRLPDADVGVRCLEYLAPWRTDAYQDGAWVEVGMALHSAGADVADWDQWSRQSNKYRPGECEQKWRSFGKREGRKVTVASLIDWAAKDAGLTRAELMQRINPVTRSVNPSPMQPPPWPDLICLDEYDLKPWPDDVLPDPLGRMVTEVANAFHVDPAMPGLCGLASVALTSHGAYLVQPIPPWVEPITSISCR